MPGLLLVEDAQAQRPQLQRWPMLYPDTLYLLLLPYVIAAATWALSGESAVFSLTIFISVLLIAVHVLWPATPTAIVVGTGRAEYGVLIKSGEALETAHKIDTIIFDKTGTITEGEPKVTDIITNGDISQDELLQFSASAEAGSEHPLGEAIVNSARDRNLELMRAESFEAIPGHGIEVIIQGKNASWQQETDG